MLNNVFKDIVTSWKLDFKNGWTLMSVLCYDVQMDQ